MLQGRVSGSASYLYEIFDTYGSRWVKPFGVCICIAVAAFILVKTSSITSCPAASAYIKKHAMKNGVPTVVNRPLCVLFGDSLTERSFDSDGGWGAALYHHFSRKVDVVNRGFGGYNTRWGIPLLEHTLQQMKGNNIEWLTIFFGANDAALPDRSASRQHVPVEEYKSNLAEMVNMAKKAGVPNVILIAPPPVDDQGRVRHQQSRMGTTEDVPPDRTLSFVGTYAAAVKELGQQLGLPTVDLWGGMQQNKGWRGLYFIDGLHFSPEGNREVARLILSTLETHLPQLQLDRMPNHYPWWDDWDFEDPEAYWKNFMKMSGGKSPWG